MKREERLKHDKPHCFTYTFDSGKSYSVTCSSIGTVLDALRQSKNFRDRVKLFPKKREDLVIVGKEHLIGIVSPHCPCSFIPDHENFHLKLIKRQDGSSKPPDAAALWVDTPTNRVLFFILCQGKELTRDRLVLKNPRLVKEHYRLCVYAFRGEKLMDTLSRDGRFKPVVFKKKSELCETKTQHCVELSSLVDDLNEKEYVLTMSEMEQENEKNKEEKKTKFQLIPDSGKVLQLLRSQFKGLLETLRERENISSFSKVQGLFREEFGKSTALFSKVWRVKLLGELSDSAGQVLVEGNPVGSGFLLFDHCVLTNAHVLEGFLEDCKRRLRRQVSVTFQHLETGSLGKRRAARPDLVAFDRSVDYALMELQPGAPLPAPLLGRFDRPPTRGGICVVGHPEGGVKKVDPCLVIEFEKRREAVDRHHWENVRYIQLFTESPRDFRELSDKGKLTYDSCFFHGSSGSPVFDNLGRLVAVHTGGYAYKLPKGTTKSFIEFAVSLWDILSSMLKQLVAGAVEQERERMETERGEHEMGEGRGESTSLRVLLQLAEASSGNGELGAVLTEVSQDEQFMKGLNDLGGLYGVVGQGEEGEGSGLIGNRGEVTVETFLKFLRMCAGEEGEQQLQEQGEREEEQDEEEEEWEAEEREVLIVEEEERGIANREMQNEGRIQGQSEAPQEGVALCEQEPMEVE
ncbi:F111A protein, partial [Amia calva]|nr:F111A protein [Amia calva]